MRPFDPSKYLQTELKPYVGSPDVPGLFERYCLDVDDADDRAIDARLREVKALWDKRSEHPTYGPLIRMLSDRHSEALLTLGDAVERSALAEQARAEAAKRAKVGEEARKRWEALVDEVVRAHGGLDPSKRAMLEKAAASARVEPEYARRRLDSAPVAAMPEVLEDGPRRDIRNALSALAQDTGEPRLGLSLFHALGMSEISLDGAAITVRHREQSELNAKRGHGNTKTAYGNVLALAKVRLLDHDPRAYIAGLLRDTGDALIGDAVSAAAKDGVIDEVAAEHLLRQALELGLSRPFAEQVLQGLARDNGLVLRAGAAVDYVACPACNAPHPRTGAPQHCRRCATPLFVLCPVDGCGTRNDATSGVCSACGTDLHRHVAALKRISTLAELLRTGHPRQAQVELEDAARVLGEVADVRAARDAVDAALAAARADWAAVVAALETRRLNAAKQLLRGIVRTARDMPGPDGTLPAERLEWVQARLGEVDEALAAARGADGTAREAALSRALAIAADCTEAESELARIPPRPVGRVKVAVDDAGVAVSWSPSPTPGVRYEITRTGAGGAGGEVVATSEATRIDDPAAKAGAVVRYAVTVLRGAGRSDPSWSEATLIAQEVSELSVLDGDGAVRLGWRPIGAAGRVLIERQAEDEREPALLTPDAAGLTDGGVVNGRRYRYRVFVEYAGSDGRPQRTPGRTVYGQPAARPEPVESLDMRPDGDRLTIAFAAPPTGTVVIVRCASEPSVEFGSELDPARVASFGTVLPTDAVGARDSASGAGTRWYLPVTVAGGMAVAGRAVRHVALPAITSVQAVEAAGSVRVTWTWPEDVRIALVVWRRDRQPVGPDDPQAERRPWRLGEYRDQGGFTIEARGDAPVFAAVFAAARVDGELIWSGSAPRSARASVVRRTRQDVHYKVRRSGRWRPRLDVQVVDSELDRLPALVLIARAGDMLPLNATDGDVIAHLGGEGPRSATVELGGRERPLAVRMFLSASSEAGAYRLQDPLPDDLVIR